MKYTVTDNETGEMGPVVSNGVPVVPTKAKSTHTIETKDESKPLDDAEKELLKQHEATIKKGLETFQEVGMAFAEIRDRGLYREYGTFDNYCRDVWKISRSKAYRYMAASKCVKHLECRRSATNENLAIPTTETQARKMAKLNPDQQEEVSKTVAKRTSKPVARDFDEASEAFTEEKPRIKSYDIKAEVTDRESAMTTNVEKQGAKQQGDVMTMASLYQLSTQIYNDYNSSLDAKVRDGLKKLKAETKKLADREAVQTTKEAA